MDSGVLYASCPLICVAVSSCLLQAIAGVAMVRCPIRVSAAPTGAVRRATASVLAFAGVSTPTGVTTSTLVPVRCTGTLSAAYNKFSSTAVVKTTALKKVVVLICK